MIGHTGRSAGLAYVARPLPMPPLCTSVPWPEKLAVKPLGARRVATVWGCCSMQLLLWCKELSYLLMG